MARKRQQKAVVEPPHWVSTPGYLRDNHHRAYQLDNPDPRYAKLIQIPNPPPLEASGERTEDVKKQNS